MTTPEQFPVSTSKKRSKKMWWIAGGVTATAVAAICCGGMMAMTSAALDPASDDAGVKVVSTASPNDVATSTPDDTAPTAPAKLGDTLQITTSLLGSKTTVEYTVKDLKTETSGLLGTAPRNGQYVFVHVTIRVIEGTTYACACNFALQGPDGRIYEETFTLVDKYPALTGADLRAGQFTEGWVAFDTTSDAAKTGKIQLKENMLSSDEPVYWSVR